jgi:hypothetical protein
VESVASILLMAIVLALLIAFMQGGVPAVGKWLHVKFVGEGG